MKDLLTAINSRLQAIDFSIGNLAVDKPEWGKGLIVLRMVEDEVMPHVRSLAALVREYGHKARCLCHGWAEAYAGSDDCDWRFGGNTPCGFKHKGEMYRDPCCLPESREESRDAER